MKRIVTASLSVVLAAALVFLPTACESARGVLIVGFSTNPPMISIDGDGAVSGFDAEFARLAGDKLNMDVEFKEINWADRYDELDSGAVDCVWCGFTANVADEDGVNRSDKVDFSYSYMLNQQCVVTKAENTADYMSAGDLTGKTAAVMESSAGESAAIGDTGSILSCDSQESALDKVRSGEADCAVVDMLLAQRFVGPSGGYGDLAVTDIAMPAEVYAVGFKKGSSLRGKINGAIKYLYNNGSLLELAVKYGLENKLSVDTKFKG